MPRYFVAPTKICEHCGKGYLVFQNIERRKYCKPCQLVVEQEGQQKYYLRYRERSALFKKKMEAIQ